MAKINLLTLHYADNNGSALQAYATCKILKDLGHEVTVINLQNKKRIIGRCKKLHNWLLFPRFYNFWRFQHRYLSPITRRMFDIDYAKISKCDYTVVGSDQVWNSDFEMVRKGFYFLDFVNDGSIKIALASSFGKKEWDAPEDFTIKIKQCLSDFKAISVREKSGVDICVEKFGVKATHLLDPTLALGDFSELIDMTPQIKNELRYFLFNKEYSLDVVNYISKHEQLQRRDANSTLFLNGQMDWNGSPIKWLHFIRDAKVWVSDSFHGVAFAIIFKKQFVALCNEKKKLERIQSLLTLLGLEEKLVLNMEELEERYSEIMRPIDYDLVYSKLRREQDLFRSFIISNIK